MRGAMRAGLPTPSERPDPEGLLAEVERLIGAGRSSLRFQDDLERAFLSEASDRRARNIPRAGLIGIVLYNLFMVTDRILMPDIFLFCLIVKTFVITPIMLIMMVCVVRRVVDPSVAMTVALCLVVGGIALFYARSTSPHAALLLFTIASCMVFGDVVTPLPFKISAAFTGYCLAAGAIAVAVRPGGDGSPCAFILITNANVAVYMLIATYRMEVSERRAFLFNRRESLRGEILVLRNRHLQDLSETDGLTGVANRRCFDAALADIEGRTAEPVSLMLIDIDHFKRINDAFGHQAGDEVLRAAASCLVRHAPAGATVARYGGEEFAVILPGADVRDAAVAAEALRSAIERLAVGCPDGTLPTPFTASIGFATRLPDSDAGPSDLVAAADRALYRAKESGRNRVKGLAPAARNEAAGLGAGPVVALAS